MNRRVWSRPLLLRVLALTIGLVTAMGVAELGAMFAESRGDGPRPSAPRLPLFDPNPHGTGSYRMKPKAVEHSKGLLDQIRLVSQEARAQLLIAAIPTAEQVYAIHPVGPGFDIAYPQTALAQWAQKTDVPFLDLLPALREATRSSGRRTYLRFDVHFNDLGHRVAGEAMARWIRRVAPSRR